MDNGNKNIKNIVIYSACSLSFVTILTTGINLSRNCPYPYNIPVFLSGYALSFGVPIFIKKLFLKNNDDSEMK